MTTIFYLTTDQYPEPLQTSLTIRGGALEKTGHPARLEVLEEIAEVTRGSLVRPDQLDSVIQAIKGLPEPRGSRKKASTLGSSTLGRIHHTPARSILDRSKDGWSHVVHVDTPS